MKVLLVLVVVSAPGAWAFAKDPDCTGVEQWPASMAFVHLKNAGLIEDEVRVTPKLAVTLGLRWESDSPYKSVKGQKWSNWLPGRFDVSRAHRLDPRTGEIVGAANNVKSANEAAIAAKGKK